MVGLALVGGLVLVALGVLVAFPPTDLVTARLAAEVERQTGRKLTVGSAGISVAGGLGVTLSNVALAAPAVMGGAPLLRADRIEVRLALLPLIVREVKVERLSLTRPTIALRVDQEGRRSWDFALREAPPVRYAQAAGRTTDAKRLPPELREFAKGSTPQPAGSGTSLGLEGLSLADVRIRDGIVRYSDLPNGLARELRVDTARLALPQAGGPLDLEGQVLLAGERLAVEGRLDTPRDLLADRTADLRLKIDGAPVSLRFVGKVTAGSAALAEGALSFQSPAAARLTALLGAEHPLARGLGAIAIDGAVKASQTGVTVSSATLAAAGSSATGSVEVALGRARPGITANLRFARLDLDRALALGSSTEPAAPSATLGRFAAPAGVVEGLPPPASIDDLLARSGEPSAGPAPRGPQVRGFRQRAGNQWDVEALDVAALRTVDLDGRFHVAELLWRGLRATDVQAAAELKDGHLRASVTDAAVASGKARGLLSIDARQPAAVAVGANLSGDGVAVGPILKSVGVEALEGRGRAVVTLSARGASERDLVSTLAGRIELRIGDGNLVGWNAEGLLASLGRGEIPSTRRSAEARTPFRQLAATFQIANGVARTKDLVVEGAAVGATGGGLVNVVDRNIDLTVRAKAAGAAIEIPVRVAGPWDEPGIVPDVAGALKTPQAQEAMRHLKEGNLEGAARSVLGNGPDADRKIDRAKDFLRQFLKP
jgi:AsmA protein